MIYIHAMDYHAARGCAAKLGLREGQWRYVMYESDLAGVNKQPMFVSGDAYMNRDHVTIMEFARAREMFIWREM